MQAVEMQDIQLLAKLASTDFIAVEVKHHAECYMYFRNSYRSYPRTTTTITPHPYRLTYGSVMSELVQYMEEMFLYSNTAPVFRLSDLTRLFANRMTYLGVHTDEKSINRPRLKEQLIQLIPGLREDKSDREVLLSFEADVVDAIHEACEYNDFTDGMCIAHAASILRRDLFNDFPKFRGSFSDGFGVFTAHQHSLLCRALY